MTHFSLESCTRLDWWVEIANKYLDMDLSQRGVDAWTQDLSLIFEEMTKRCVVG